MGHCLGKIGVIKTNGEWVEWRIPHFLSLSTKLGEYYESGSFQQAGERWHLSISPLDVTVHLMKEASSTGSSATFKVGLKRIDGTFEGEGERCRSFGAGSDSWRFSFPSRSSIESRISDLAPFGTLVILCFFKSKETHMKSWAIAAALKKSSELEKVFIQRPYQSKCSIAAAVRKSSELEKVSTQRPYQSKCWTEKLSNDLSELLLTGEDSDLTINVRGTEFRLHRLIVKARTPVFNTMLMQITRNKVTGTVYLDDCDAEVFRAFVRYVYTGRADRLSADTAFGLYAIADKYQVDELGSACLEYVQSTLSVDTFCDALSLAVAHNQRDLLERATDYFARRMEDILQTVKWRNFARQNFVRANELVLKAVQKNNSK